MSPNHMWPHKPEPPQPPAVDMENYFTPTRRQPDWHHVVVAGAATFVIALIVIAITLASRTPAPIDTTNPWYVACKAQVAGQPLGATAVPDACTKLGNGWGADTEQSAIKAGQAERQVP